MFLQLVKQAILPRVHALALKTTVAAVCTFIHSSSLSLPILSLPILFLSHAYVFYYLFHLCGQNISFQDNHVFVE